jgi:hypothetical protein
MARRVLPGNVFVNCPFDTRYRPIFNGQLFAILDLGFVPRCALEFDDATENRLEKILRIIEECEYGIHDISAVALGEQTNLPRFNMPLELGLFLGCQRFGSRAQKRKFCLVLDEDQFRYRASMSDISGQDIHAHGGVSDRAITELRNWLATHSRPNLLPGGANLVTRYKRFQTQTPEICAALRLDPGELTYSDYCHLIREWIQGDR